MIYILWLFLIVVGAYIGTVCNNKWKYSVGYLFGTICTLLIFWGGII